MNKNDEVIISDKEHNSNLIPWLHKKVSLKVVPSHSDGTFDLEEFEKIISENTKLVSVTHTSNLDGVENPVKDICKIAHEHNVKVLIDGAQDVPGKPLSVKKSNCDFLSFSGHKMLGPTGTGILYGKNELLEELPQFLTRGETVEDSTYEQFIPEKLPMKFEAGLQDYANIMGLGEATSYLRKINPSSIHKHEIKLNKMLTDKLSDIQKLRIFGPSDAEKRSGIFFFHFRRYGCSSYFRIAQ